MVQSTDPGECPADLITGLVETATRDTHQGLSRIDDLLREYGGDPRLHFLRGSLLASQREYGEAREAMQAAIDIAPGYAVARFQLGLLELSSGDPVGAMATLRPLEALAPDDALRLFAQGLHHLVADDFAHAVQFLREGMARNTENLPLNGDMQMLVDEALEALNAQGQDDDTPISAAHLLLQQYADKAAKQ